MEEPIVAGGAFIMPGGKPRTFSWCQSCGAWHYDWKIARWPWCKCGAELRIGTRRTAEQGGQSNQTQGASGGNPQATLEGLVQALAQFAAASGAPELQAMVAQFAPPAQGAKSQHAQASKALKEASGKVQSLDRQRVNLETRRGQLKVQIRQAEEDTAKVDLDIIEAKAEEAKARQAYEKACEKPEEKQPETISDAKQGEAEGTQPAEEEEVVIEMELDTEGEAFKDLTPETKQIVVAAAKQAAGRAAKRARVAKPPSSSQASLSQPDQLHQAATTFAKALKEGLGKQGTWRAAPYHA